MVEDFLDSLPEKYYYVKFIILHNANEVRTMVIFDDTGRYTLLDMSIKRWKTIPVAIKYADGRLLVLSEPDIRKDMPYSGKQYTEKVYKKPYREQDFRQKILFAYNNKCVVCGNNNIKHLRAAHIKDAASGGKEETYNGICLSANHEISFDNGDLKITPTGEIIVIIKDDIIVASHISYPDNENDWPSKELLKWKYYKYNKEISRVTQ